MLAESKIQLEISAQAELVCAWCKHKISKNGIRLREKVEHPSTASHGICGVCAVEYFK